VTRNDDDNDNNNNNNNNNNNLRVYQFSSVTPVTGSQSLFTIVAGSLRVQGLNSSASSPIPLPFPTSFLVFVSFLPKTRSLFV
jgi:hypothetical protein